jgi:hypothetical protein
MPSRLAVAAAGLGFTLFAEHAGAACPDGWFCEDTPAPAPSAPTGPQPPGAPARPPAPPPGLEPVEPAPLPPSSVAEAPGTPLEEPDEGTLEPGAHESEFETGFNLHFGLGLFGPGANKDAVLGGGGLAFRLRPLPLFAVDLGLEFMTGTDYNGNDRNEQAFVASGLFFMNPRDRVQAFVLAGVNVGGAQAKIEHLGGVALSPHDANYSYLGVQGGLGVEWRFAESTALTGDFQLFSRWRIESGDTEPEYVDPSSHLTTNASGGGLFRVGATFYF